MTDQKTRRQLMAEMPDDELNIQIESERHIIDASDDPYRRSTHSDYLSELEEERALRFRERVSERRTS